MDEKKEIKITPKEITQGYNLYLKADHTVDIVVYAKPEDSGKPPDGWWVSDLEVKPSESEAPEGKSVGVIDSGDYFFNANSICFLPAFYKETEDDIENIGTSGLGVLSHVLCHAAGDDDVTLKLLITGHTDVSGTQKYNRKISKFRAQMVRCILSGDASSRGEWTDMFISSSKNGVQTFINEDIQQIMHWAYDEDGLDWGDDLNPGKIDGQLGENSQRAIKAFQEKYNEEFGKSIPANGHVGTETWGAIFDVYQAGLMDLLDVDESAMDSEYRNRITWLNDGVIGCGEASPLETIEDDEIPNRTGRRIEFLFFDDDDTPSLPCDGGQCDTKSCPIYRDNDVDEEDEDVYGKVPISADNRSSLFEFDDF